MARMRFIFFLTILGLLSACAAKKRAAEMEARPAWVKQKPVVPGYFTGVGAAKKTGTRTEYTERARRDALADLAGEISVQVSASSVLRTIETEYGKSNLYNQRIEITTDDYLEGFEPVDSYEDETTYWVYYRIDKTTYYANKARRKQEALANAKAKFIAGQQAAGSHSPGEALSFYLQGLTAIKAFLGEETPVKLDGQTEDIGNKLFTSLNGLLSALEIKPLTKEVTVKRGQKPDHPLQFEVTYNGRPVKNIPVIFKFSGGYLVSNKALTDENGRVSALTGKIRSKNSSEQLTAVIDLAGIAQKATDDLFIRSLPDYGKAEKAVIRINIARPGVSLHFENSFCANNDCAAIIKLFEKDLLREGFVFVQVPAADYNFVLDLKYTAGETAGGLTSVYLSGSLNVFDENAKLVWSKNITPAKGVGSSRREAREKAFATLLKNLDLIYFRQGLNAIQ